MTATLEASTGQTPPPATPHRVKAGLLDPKMLWTSLPDAVRKLNPATLYKNPVMFIVEIGAVFTTVVAIADPSVFAWLIVIWLWLTALFANVAEAVAEGRGKAQADALRRAKTDTIARRLVDRTSFTGAEEPVPAPQLRQGDVVVCEAGDIIPGDGDVIVLKQSDGRFHFYLPDTLTNGELPGLGNSFADFSGFELRHSLGYQDYRRLVHLADEPDLQLQYNRAVPEPASPPCRRIAAGHRTLHRLRVAGAHPRARRGRHPAAGPPRPGCPSCHRSRSRSARLHSRGARSHPAAGRRSSRSSS